MSEAFKIEIVSPEKIILSSDIVSATIPSYEGNMTILKDHIPIITYLRPGFINLEINNSIEDFYVEEGTVEFSKNKLLVLSSTVIKIKEFKNSEIEKLVAKTQDSIKDPNITDRERYILSYKLETLREIAK
tara:strand:+ start:146 stop:538 length:393 start_codon:yes stop_codon:yes gene_type:complete